MARDIDRIIGYIRNLEQGFISPVQRQVIINRIEGDGPPSREELDRAMEQVHHTSSIRDGLRAAKARAEALPPRARPVVTRPVWHGYGDCGGRCPEHERGF